MIEFNENNNTVTMPMGKELVALFNVPEESRPIAHLQNIVVRDLKEQLEDQSLELSQAQLDLARANSSIKKLQYQLSLDSTPAPYQESVVDTQALDDANEKIATLTAQLDALKIKDAAKDTTLERTEALHKEAMQSCLGQIESQKVDIKVLEKEKESLASRLRSQSSELEVLTQKIAGENERFKKRLDKQTAPLAARINELTLALDKANEVIDASQPIIEDINHTFIKFKNTYHVQEEKNKNTASLMAKASTDMVELKREIARIKYVNDLMQRTLQVFPCESGDIFLLSLYSRFLPETCQETDYPLFFYLSNSGEGHVLFVGDGELKTMDGLELHQDIIGHEQEIYAKLTTHSSQEIEQALKAGDLDAAKDSALAYLSEDVMEIVRYMNNFMQVIPWLPEEEKQAMERVKKHLVHYKGVREQLNKKMKKINKRSR